MNINVKTKYATGDKLSLKWGENEVSVTISTILIYVGDDGDIFYKYTVLLDEPIGQTFMLEGLDDDEFIEVR